MSGTHNAINRIIETERAAKEMTEAAEQKKRDLDEQLKKEESELRDRLYKDAGEQISKIAADEELETARILARLDDKLGADMAYIDKQYSDHHEEWVSALFKKITG